MAGINRTSNALWRGPAVAEVKLSPERWAALVAGLGRDLFADGVERVTVADPVEIDGVTFLPAVYFPA